MGTMRELTRDTIFCDFLRIVSGKKLYQYPEERDPSIWTKYVDQEKSRELRNSRNEAQDGLGQSRERSGSETEGPNEKTDRENSTASSPSKTSLADDVHTSNQAPVVGADPEKGRDVNVIGWYGEHDPENPMNWSRPKKIFVTFQICLLTFGIYIGSAIYSAGILDVTKKFGVSQVAATLGLALFVAGYGIGPMIWSPLSEIPQIGRNKIYIGTLVIFVILQVPTALATNFGMLLAFRFLTGFFGSPVLATGGATLADIYRPKRRAYAMGIWGVSAVCGPTMGPLVGGFAAQARGWTWTIWELMWLSGFALIVLIFFLPETSANNILYRRTRRLRKLTEQANLTCEPELMAAEMSGKDIAMMVLVRPITLNFKEPIVLALNLYIALIYGLLYIWFESFPIVFVEIYKFDLGQEGLAFLGIFVGAMVVIPPFFLYLYKVLEPQFNERGDIAPEKRLPPACVGAFAIPICLFWFGWSARPDVHWIMPIIGSGFFSIGAFLLFNSVLNYLPDAYPEYAASVLAGNDFMRSAFGTGFPLFASAMYKKLGVAWASSTLGFLAIAFIPIPFVLYYYGEKIRKRSKNARQDF